MIGFLAAVGTAVLAGQADWRFGYVALAGTAAYLLGLSDDERWIGPRAKFAGQIAIAAAMASVIHPAWLPRAVAVPVPVPRRLAAAPRSARRRG